MPRLAVCTALAVAVSARAIRSVPGRTSVSSIGAPARASVSSSAPVTVSPTDGSLYFSPYGWLVTPASASTIQAGAYMKVLFSGNSVTLTFDVSNMVTPVSQVYARIDEGPLLHYLVQPSLVLAVPANNTHGDVPYHTLELRVKSTTERAARWAAAGPSTRVVLTSLTLEAGGALAPWLPSGVNLLVYGDSISEGVLTLGGSQPDDTDHNDNSVCWSSALGPLLGAEVGVVGFGATGLSRGGSGGVPALGVSYNQLWEGVPRSFTPRPDLVILNEGTNDGATNITAAYTAVLAGIVAAAPGTPIAVLLPFNGAEAACLQAAVAACGAPCHYIDTTGFYNQSLGGALHPTGPNDVARLAPQIAAKLRPLLARSLARRFDGEGV